LKWIQKIYFGMPGTGKSHKVHNDVIKNELNIIADENIINTVFHPEYSYGDFMGKLLPITNELKQVEYNYYEGFFLKALAQAYKNILNNKDENVVLVIDEINRGNSSAIFGSIFQLLDRDEDGLSSYSINISDMEFNRLVELMGLEKDTKSENYRLNDSTDGYKSLVDLFSDTELKDSTLLSKQIQIPANFSIIGTMNTSDESIYYMDSAFKRRWDWEYINNYWGRDKESEETCPESSNEHTRADETNYFILKDLDSFINIETTHRWVSFINSVNQFLVQNSDIIRGIEDKQIGYWFIKSEFEPIEKMLIIPKDKIKNKLMFFLWDSVFSRDKEPLNELLLTDETTKLRTFGDFQDNTDKFIEKVMENYSDDTFE